MRGGEGEGEGGGEAVSAGSQARLAPRPISTTNIPARVPSLPLSLTELHVELGMDEVFVVLVGEGFQVGPFRRNQGLHDLLVRGHGLLPLLLLLRGGGGGGTGG